ncbi:MFS transporter [Cellulomonas rhizosphaerae]|uniref:MFS transporter n=1 Tax=Cellulomonas rhizosphaerae TaxID=2293719 RepID=A0A413RGY1_9CELL|nr:MFS transporter [Cellulomonas rhizosphaerae]RHA37044.1 MFS transporter [Cellulomonas rhizosphaerae]
MLGPYADVLKRPGALAFSASGALARLPMSMVGIGIVLMVSAIYDSYGLAGRVSAVYVIAQAVCSPQLSRLVDRHGQARIMRPAVAVSAAGLVGLIVAAIAEAPEAVLYVTAAVTGAAIGSFGSLVRARWSSELSDPRQLHTAYALESAVDELVFVVGPVAATLLATGVEPTAGLIVPLVAMIVGGYWFCALRATEPAVAPKDQPRPTGSVLRTPAMLVLVLVFVAMGSIFGANDVSTVAFADEAGQKNLAGPVLAVFAAGSLVSGLLYGTRHWKRPLHQRFANGMIALAVGVSLFFLVDSLWMLAAVMFVTGFAIAPTLINGNALVQQLVPPERLTEGLTWVGTALGVGVSVGSSIAGAQIDADGSHAGFRVVVVSAIVAVVAVLLSYRTLRGKHTGHVHDKLEDQSVSASAGASVSAAELAECVESNRFDDDGRSATVER